MIFNDGIPPLNVFFYGPQSWNLQVLFHWWQFPPAIPSKTSCLSCNSSGHQMMKSLKNHQQWYLQHPANSFINKHSLNHFLLHNFQWPHRRSCLFRYFFQHSPLSSGLLKKLQCQSVAVIVCNYVAQVQEGYCGIHWLLNNLWPPYCWAISYNQARH